MSPLRQGTLVAETLARTFEGTVVRASFLEPRMVHPVLAPHLPTFRSSLELGGAGGAAGGQTRGLRNG